MDDVTTMCGSTLDLASFTCMQPHTNAQTPPITRLCTVTSTHSSIQFPVTHYTSSVTHQPSQLFHLLFRHRSKPPVYLSILSYHYAFISEIIHPHSQASICLMNNFSLRRLTLFHPPTHSAIKTINFPSILPPIHPFNHQIQTLIK